MVLTIFTKNGERKVLSMDEFRLRFHMLPRFLFQNAQIISEATPIFAGANTVHLKGRRFGLADDTRQFSSMNRIYLKYAIKHPNPPKGIVRQYEYNYHLELPPAAVRPLLKRVNVTLYAPHWFDFTERILGRAIAEDEPIWAAEDVDWMYPIREMTRLGFTKFERLSTKVVYQDYANAKMEKEFRAWVKEKINDVAEAKQLEIFFCRARDE